MCCRCCVHSKEGLNESKYSRTKSILLHYIVLLVDFYMHQYAVPALRSANNQIVCLWFTDPF